MHSHPDMLRAPHPCYCNSGLIPFQYAQARRACTAERMCHTSNSAPFSLARWSCATCKPWVNGKWVWSAKWNWLPLLATPPTSQLWKGRRECTRYVSLQIDTALQSQHQCLEEYTPHWVRLSPALPLFTFPGLHCFLTTFMMCLLLPCLPERAKPHNSWLYFQHAPSETPLGLHKL